jgi:hypothetical protein
LGPNHGPDHLFLSPGPAQLPAWCLDVPVLLEIEHRNNSLKLFGRNMS